ncbi:hypothetical protein B0H16DRAFT_1799330 [Mycena metata]|uniref:Uncharacterized protein n=1 Tax=Mycena metata TaxID=1033252 RepID=A0AAD7HCU3_9AGAR|nr:hypothetical protein B0H16DRAFT_1799330 [Mycena metata]
MVFLRTAPTGTTKITQTRGKAFLYTTLRMSLVEIETMTKVPAGRKKKIPAANMNIGHVGARIKRLPFLKMEDIFTNTEAPIIHDCVVSVGEQRFLISAHYRPTEAINGGLQKAFPGYAWRGEIVAVALGRVNPYVDKVKNALYKEAINKKGQADVGPGAFPRRRKSTGVKSKSLKFVPGLPINMYDQGWLEGDMMRKYDLRPTALPYDFTHDENIMDSLDDFGNGYGLI